MIRIATLSLAAVLLASGPSAAEAALAIAPSPAKVSDASATRASAITVFASKDHALVSKRLTFSGSYSSKRQVRVALQQKADGRWQTVETATTDSQGKYKVAHRTTEPGALVFRTVAVGEKATSLPVNVLVEQWHYLTDLTPTSSDCRQGCRNESTQLKEVVYDRSIVYSTSLDEGNPDRGASRTYALYGQCSLAETYVGVTDYSGPDTTMTMGIATDGTTRFEELYRQRAGAEKRAVQVDGANELTLSWMHTGLQREDGAFASPRIRCAW